MADLKQIAETLVNLTVKEVNELATILKDEYGIEPAAAAAGLVAGGGADEMIMKRVLSSDGLLQKAAERMTEELCGTSTVLDKLWYVEEKDMWALALDGRFTKTSLPLLCK